MIFGEVVGINYAGNVLFPSGYNIQESSSLQNYAVPADIMIDELKANLSEGVFGQIGFSNAKKISVNMLNEKIDKISDQLYSDENFEKLMNYLKETRTFYHLKTAKNYYLKNTDIKNILSSINFQNDSIKRLLEIMAKGLDNIYISFVETFKDQLFFNHHEILKNKNKYIETYNKCYRKYNRYWVDGCLFENLFRPLYNRAFLKFEFSESQKNAIWQQLVKMAHTSNDRYFAYTTSQMNSLIADYAHQEIAPVEYMIACILGQKEKFFHIYSHVCKETIRPILVERGYTQIDSDLISRTYRKFILDKEFVKVIESFADDVTKRNFTCFFNNKRCERAKYTQLLANWEYGPSLSTSTINDLVDVLVELHNR